MSRSEITLILDLSIKQLTDLFLAISVLSLISIPLALAAENQTSFEGKPGAQRTVPATAQQEAQSSLEKTLEAQLPKTSVDFLMERSPTLSEVSTTAAPQKMPAPTPAPETTPAALQALKGTALEKTEEVAMLVSEQCSQSGEAADGTNSCKRTYSNGHHVTVLTQNANEGDELKHQTVIEEYDEDNTLLYRKTIRHRVDFNYLKDQKAKEKEFFDIIYQPAGRKSTRELMVYEFFLDTGKAKSLSWTQYAQIGNEPKAGLAYHAALHYGADGSPERGIAEQWDHGKKTETFMNWSRRSKGFATLDEETWGQWEGWIQNVSLQAYLP